MSPVSNDYHADGEMLGPEYREFGKLPKGLFIGSLLVMATACIILSWLTSPAPQQELQSTDRTMPIEAQHESTP